MYSAPVALPVYAQVFEDNDALDRLEGFASLHGPAFYGLPVNTTTITLERENWQVPKRYPVGDDAVVPLCAGQELAWRLAD